MRLLKRTSKHHQPAHLAAAVALGIVVGLVPKANLLAVGLYAALLLLPIHTWLALAVSALVACTAGLFDPLSDALGGWLLRQPGLSRLWYFFDNTAVLPWLGLHNTVVLGSLVSGLTIAAPAYFIALRLFERTRLQLSGHPASSHQDETILLPPQPAIVPAPRPAELPPMAALPADRSPGDRLPGNPSDAEEFEPARQAAEIVRSWHAAHVAQESLKPRMMDAASAPATAGPSDQLPSAVGPNPHDHAAAEASFQPAPFTPPPRPWASERSEIVDSLDLAHSASDVLAWVDDMLEECLSADSTRIATRDLGAKIASPAEDSHATEAQPPNTGSASDSDGREERWLMETTIEVVRWGEEAPPALPPTDAEKTHDAPQAASGSADESSWNSAHGSPRTDGNSAPRDGRGSDAQRSGSVGGQPVIVPFQPSGLPGSGSAQSPSQEQERDAGEPPRGECLSYLLGHLRQEREGRTS